MNNKDEKINKEDDFIGILFGGGALKFYLKLFIVFILCSISFEYVISKLKFKNENLVRIYAKGMVSNPEAFVIAYEEHMRMGKMNSAVCDLRFAIGLMKLNKYPEAELKSINIKLAQLIRDGHVCD